MSFFFCSPSKFFLKLFTLLIPFFLFSCSSGRITTNSGPGFSSAPPIRILVNEPSSGLELLLSSNCRIFSDDKSFEINIGRGETLKFSVSGKLNLNVKRALYHGTFFLIRPQKSLTYNNKVLQGDLKVVTDGSAVYLINLNDIETYLKGVIPAEMPLGRGSEYFEALKAFSVCARTYTLQRIASSGKIFDVRTDVRDQVYGGAGGHQEISNRAVDETRGVILKYDGRPASVFYSSTCGGYTEDVDNVFGNQKIPYLQSIKDGDPSFCSEAPRFKWEERFTEQRIISLLKKGGKIKSENYKLTDIKVLSRFRSGRVNELQIKLRGNEGSISVSLYGNNIRFILLTSREQPLNSNQFNITRTGGGYIFDGKGWGHGVGMCQWGSLIQSVQGNDYLSILNHYFKGTEILKQYD